MRSGAQPAPRVPRSFGALDVLFAVVAVIALSSLGYFGFTTFRSAPPTQTAAPPPAAATVAHVAAAEWTDADSTRCKARARAAASAPIPGETMMANPAVTEGYAGLATLVECALTTKPTRFCTAEGKAQLVSIVNDFQARGDLVVIGLGVEGAPMAIMGQFTGGEVAAGSDIHDIMRDQTLAFMDSYKAKVSAALRKLARDGIASPADFSGFMGASPPEHIVKMFGGTAATRNLCA